MTTLRDFLYQTRGSLIDADIPDPRLEAEMILSHELQVARHRLYAFQNDVLTSQQLGNLESIVARRIQREPLAYILGHREFYGVDLQVSSAVMVPRSETELLVERALLVCLEQLAKDSLVVVDVGTGSGCIAINLAMHLPMCTVLAVDISAEALDVARVNVQNHHLGERITLMKGDLLENIDGPVDVLVGNLPYIPTGRLDQLSPEVRCEPRSALDGGCEGVDQLIRLLEQAATKLAPRATVLLEIDPGQSPVLEKTAMELFGDAVISIEQDLAGLDRLFVMQVSGNDL